MLRMLMKILTHNKICRKGLPCRLMNSVCSFQTYTNTTSQMAHHIYGVHTNIPQDACKAVVKELRDLSATVKGLKLHIANKDFSFRAGQWVDMFIPTVPVIGGFSMCSAPHLLHESGVLELAIKLSPHPPVQWVHQQCEVGSEVALKCGGDFFFDPRPSDPVRDILLIAGGVGINPLISMMRHAADLAVVRPAAVSRIVLLYSAGSVDELIFHNEIRDLVSANSNMSALFFVTRSSSSAQPTSTNFTINYQRITRDILSSVLQSSFTVQSNIDCYVCGPNSMIDSIDSILLQLGLYQRQIKYEKWW